MTVPQDLLDLLKVASDANDFAGNVDLDHQASIENEKKLGADSLTAHKDALDKSTAALDKVKVFLAIA